MEYEIIYDRHGNTFWAVVPLGIRDRSHPHYFRTKTLPDARKLKATLDGGGKTN